MSMRPVFEDPILQQWHDALPAFQGQGPHLDVSASELAALVARVRSDTIDKAVAAIRAEEAPDRLPPRNWHMRWFVTKRNRRLIIFGWDWHRERSIRAVGAVQGAPEPHQKTTKGTG